MKVRLAAFGLIVLCLGGSAASGSIYPNDIQGVARGSFVFWDDICRISWQRSAQLTVDGQFGFGGRPWGGSLSLHILQPCDGNVPGPFDPVPFSGTGLLGSFVSGTCYVLSMELRSASRIPNMDIQLTCTGSVSTAAGEGPTSDQFVRIRTVAVEDLNECDLLPEVFPHELCGARRTSGSLIGYYRRPG